MNAKRKRSIGERLERNGHLRVTTTSDAVELWRICVWCNRREADTKGVACSAPDGDGHLFRLSPHVPAQRIEGNHD